MRRAGGLPARQSCGGCSGSLFSFEKFGFVLAKMPHGLGAGHGSCVLVDFSMGWTSF
jgi:hypothetical protein